ncbi:MAG: hypothetical protein LUD22_03855 [Coprobacillus sp.]|nr:hypothetical protein [Coprobacillus sp.]
MSMYCHNCGKRIDELKAEKKVATLSKVDIETELPDDTEIVYSCPRCGEHIHHDLTPEEMKGLSRAAHEQYQKGSNDFAIGMCQVVLAIIALVLGAVFLILARKPAYGFVLQTDCTEFYVGLVLLAVGLVLLVVGLVYVVRGCLKRKEYSNLLKSINNGIFIQ